LRLSYSLGFGVRYVAVPELQKQRGVWHFHQLVFNMAYRDGVKDFFAERWGNGFIKYQTVKSLAGSIRYVSKYFSKEFNERGVNQKRFFRSDLIEPVQITGGLEVELARQYLDGFPREIVPVQGKDYYGGWLKSYRQYTLPFGYTFNGSELVKK